MIRAAEGAADWSPDDLVADEGWIIALDAGARADLRDAVAGAAGSGRGQMELLAADFPLGRAAPALARAINEVNEGRGIALVKGLPADLSEEDFRLLTWGIGLHLGVARPQNKASDYLTAVRDTGMTYKSGVGRGYNTRSGLDFHTDFADVVALSCLRTAKEGGQSKVVSSYRSYRLLCESEPNLARILYEPFWYSRQWELAHDESPTYPCSVFATHKGELFVRYVRKNITNAQELRGVPRLEQRQLEALDRFDALVSAPESVYSMSLEPGDLQLLNNFRVLHSRSEFIDHIEPERKRLLFRLWLSVPGSHELPGEWTPCHGDVRAGAPRGGVRGENYDASHQIFERRRAHELGMTYEKQD